MCTRVNTKQIFRSVLLAAVLVALVACSSMSKQSGPRSVDVPADVRDAFNRAMVEVNAQNYEKSEELLSEVISQSQQTPVPQINLALVQQKLGKLEDAEQSLKAALEIDPLNPVASNELGLLYRKTGRFEEARQVYEAVLSKYPNYPAANKNLGILCDLYLRDYVCAYNAYQAYSNAVPDDENAMIWVMDTKRRAGI